jgi:hypothetical protein
VTTDNGAPGVPARLQRATDGWEAEEIDLTPYAGRSSALRGLRPHLAGPGRTPGWLLDDISITAELLACHPCHQQQPEPGLGRNPRAAQPHRTRRVITLTNAPPGEYQFDFGDVRTSSLRPPEPTPSPREYAGRHRRLHLPDTNANGLSDAWNSSSRWRPAGRREQRIPMPTARMILRNSAPGPIHQRPFLAVLQVVARPTSPNSNCAGRPVPAGPVVCWAVRMPSTGSRSAVGCERWRARTRPRFRCRSGRGVPVPPRAPA